MLPYIQEYWIRYYRNTWYYIQKYCIIWYRLHMCTVLPVIYINMYIITCYSRYREYCVTCYYIVSIGTCSHNVFYVLITGTIGTVYLYIITVYLGSTLPINFEGDAAVNPSGIQDRKRNIVLFINLFKPRNILIWFLVLESTFYR